jgi:hypothetical protein|tara:strand:- start:1075 stop:1668 length:594 start_codon:yes stop_codon:yes gene_type:complete
MEHFINIVMDKQEVTEQLDESVFPNSVVLETAQDVTIYQIPLDRELTNEEADEYADRLSKYMFSEGYDDFDIEVSLGNEDDIAEETYEDDDEFYQQYGMMHYNLDDDPMDEAEYQGRKVKLGKPMQGDVKKFKVYVKDPKTGNVKKVNFGHGGSSVKGKAMSIKKNNPKRRKSFRARHNCDNPGPRTKARYWSCRKW